MAQNNVTEVVNGIVQPRFYQVYGDLIESKEVMEPLAIMAGTGPICGFDWVDTTQQNVTITSVFKRPGTLPSGMSNILGRARRVFLSNKDNTAGQVFNAYTTPDGLCHIAPDVLTFNGVQPSGGWPNLSNPQKLVAFAVKATHTYRPDGSENPPSVTNFTCDWLTFDDIYGIEEILSWGYERMLELLADSGMPFNKNVDSLIGVYLVGWRPEWNSDPNSQRYKSIMASLNYTLCLVPTQGQFPVKPYGLNPLDILDLKNRVKVLEQSTIPVEVGDLTAQVSNLMKSLGQVVEVEVTKTGSDGEDDVYTFTKLNVSGSKFVTDSPVEKKLHYQWIEGADAVGIFISPDIDISKPTTVPSNKWELGTVLFGINEQGAMIYQDINAPYQHEDWKFAGCIMLQLSPNENDSPCIPTGFYHPTNPDAAMGWRMAIAMKRLVGSKSMYYETADSGLLNFNPSSATDHYAYVKAIMGVNTLTLRVVVCLLNQGTANASLNYNLAMLFQKNSKMSRMMGEILRLKNNSESITRIFMSMPTTFKAKDIELELAENMDCEFQKYSAYLSIANNTANIVVNLRGMTKATGAQEYIELGHEITIPIHDITEDLYNRTLGGEI